jgi:hypothetical protein
MKTFIATIVALMTLVAAPAFADEPKPAPVKPAASAATGEKDGPCPGTSQLQAVGSKGDGKTGTAGADGGTVKEAK